MFKLLAIGDPETQNYKKTQLSSKLFQHSILIYSNLIQNINRDQLFTIKRQRHLYSLTKKITKHAVSPNTAQLCENHVRTKSLGLTLSIAMLTVYLD